MSSCFPLLFVLTAADQGIKRAQVHMSSLSSLLHFAIRYNPSFQAALRLSWTLTPRSLLLLPSLLSSPRSQSTTREAAEALELRAAALLLERFSSTGMPLCSGSWSLPHPTLPSTEELMSKWPLPRGPIVPSDFNLCFLRRCTSQLLLVLWR